MGRWYCKSSHVWPDPKSKLEHSKESVFEVPDSPLLSQDEPSKTEALDVVLPLPGLIAVAIGSLESDNRKLRIILDYIEHHKLCDSYFLVTSSMVFPILPKLRLSNEISLSRGNIF
jgi:hypothetical protein